MLFGIVGLSKSGKSTVFNALTQGRAQTTASVQASGKPNLGVAQVPDPRLDTLATMFSPERTIPAEIHYTDIPGATETPGKGHAIGGPFLNTLQQTDALLVIARAFKNPSVPHLQGTVDPYRDAATMQLEMAFSDLIILERRSQRLQKELKGANATERNRIQREIAFITRLKEGLETNIPVREQSLSSEEQDAIADYQFLTAKPLLILFNIGEEQLPNLDALAQEMASRLNRPGARAMAMCGKLEMELAQMDPEDEREFRASLEAGESGEARIARLSYHLLAVISFFTTVSNEVKAWTVPKDTPAVQAAGGIHSDMERCFIQAEVVSYDDLTRCGSIADARHQGLLRSEGRPYPVQDGDVTTFLFNV